MKNLFCAIGVFALLLTSLTGVFAQKTLLFKITGNGLSKPSYVFGTLHLICQETYKLPKPVKKAIIGSNVICTEVEGLTSEEVDTAISKFWMAAQDSSLDKLLSADEYKKVGSFIIDTLERSIEEFKALKPNRITSYAISNLEPYRIYRSFESLLFHYYPNKQDKGLETIAYHEELLMSAPIVTQAKILVETVNDWNKGKAELKKMTEAYVAGNLDLLYKLMNESETSAMMNKETMFDGRRENWVKKMPALMKKQSVFFAVGAGHLPGKNGVLALLKAKGYTVMPVALN